MTVVNMPALYGLTFGTIDDATPSQPIPSQFFWPAGTLWPSSDVYLLFRKPYDNALCWLPWTNLGVYTAKHYAYLGVWLSWEQHAVANAQNYHRWHGL